MNELPGHVRACPCCGLSQRVEPPPVGMRVCCCRCGTSLVKRSTVARSNSRTAAVALAALIIYPFAVSMPIVEIEEMGHASAASILSGIVMLMADGHVLVGLIVLLCSVIAPIGKLVSLLVLSAGGLGMRRRHRALTYRIVEWTGRWGMLDVLAVAVLVAVLKIGDMVEVTAGPAALAFAACVVLSLLAAASFDPHALWESDP